MSTKGWIRWLVSPEGPFARRPAKPLRQFIRGIANVLGVGIYEWSEEDRNLMAKFIALHKNECLFLLFRIHEELRRMLRDGDEKWTWTYYVLIRLYGSQGYELLSNAAFAFQQQDALAADLARQRGRALALASLGDPSELKALPQFQQGVSRGRELAGEPSETAPRDDDWKAAFYGLHAVWFADTMNNQAFGDWLAAEKTAAALGKVVGRFMQRAAKAEEKLAHDPEAQRRRAELSKRLDAIDAEKASRD